MDFGDNSGEWEDQEDVISSCTTRASWFQSKSANQMLDEASILVTIAILHIKGRSLRHWFYRLSGTTLVHYLHGSHASSAGERTYQCLCAPLERSTTSASDELLACERMGHAITIQL